MHIPDGYLGPQTYLTTYAVSIPLWAVASAVVKRRMPLSRVPLLALSAAFCFVIMMFNVPIPGGTSGHAVGSVLVAILLGPWEAVIAVTLTLVVQAMLFGDGGITCIGANSLTMAVLMPLAGWSVYRFMISKGTPSLRRQMVAGVLAGYVGVNVAALATAVLLGIQPVLCHDAFGRPIYCPYGVSVTVPAMMIGHLALIGIVEATVTGFVLSYLYRTDPNLLGWTSGTTSGPVPPGRWQRLAIGLVVLVLLTPIGLYLPIAFHSGASWGEWGSQELEARVGFVPKGLGRLETTWRAPLPDYSLEGDKPSTLFRRALTYTGAGLLGVLVVGSVTLLLRRQIAGRDPSR